MADVFIAGYWLGTFVEFLVFLLVYLIDCWRRMKERHEQEEKE